MAARGGMAIAARRIPQMPAQMLALNASLRAPYPTRITGDQR